MESEATRLDTTEKFESIWNLWSKSFISLEDLCDNKQKHQSCMHLLK